MNKIKYFLILLITAITFASCSTTTYASAQSPYEYDDTYTTQSVTF